jgi:hypothetical protein
MDPTDPARIPNTGFYFIQPLFCLKLTELCTLYCTYCTVVREKNILHPLEDGETSRKTSVSRIRLQYLYLFTFRLFSILANVNRGYAETHRTSISGRDVA